MEVSADHVKPGDQEPTVDVAQSAAAYAQLSSLPPPCNMFLSGYMDCVHESLWYLIEVEKLPLDHPMVVGLKMNLYEQYGMLHLEYMLRQRLRVCLQGEMSQNRLESENEASPEVPNVIENGINESANKSAIQTDTVLISKTIVGVPSNATGAENVPKHVAEISNDVQENESATKDSGLSPQAQRVAIALAEEIFLLLQGHNDPENSDDEEEESIDEGFEEMTEV